MNVENGADKVSPFFLCKKINGKPKNEKEL